MEGSNLEVHGKDRDNMILSEDCVSLQEEVLLYRSRGLATLLLSIAWESPGSQARTRLWKKLTHLLNTCSGTWWLSTNLYIGGAPRIRIMPRASSTLVSSSVCKFCGRFSEGMQHCPCHCRSDDRTYFHPFSCLKDNQSRLIDLPNLA